MAPRTAMTPDTLAALGAERLARLVLDETARNAPFKRIVTAALAGAKGGAAGAEAVAALIDRRLASLERARGFVGWDKRRAFVADLAAVLSTIVDELGAADPAGAASRLLRFLAGGGAVVERVEDSSGSLFGVYERAADGLPALLRRCGDEDRTALVERLAPALLDDEHGLVGAAVHAAIPALGAADLAALDHALAAAAAAQMSPKDREQQLRRDRLLRVRKAIADAGSNVDAFIALEMQNPEQARDHLDIAERLLAAGRTAEALTFARKPRRPGLRAATALDIADGTAGIDVYAHRRARLEIAILAASKDVEAAQRLRWSTFETDLDAALLRAFLAALPDFEDEEALDRAIALAGVHPARHRALAFLLEWPRLSEAAALVLRHAAAWDGRYYEVMAPAAQTLRHDHPVAATVLYRAMVNDILERGRSPAYGHGARHLATLADIETEAVAGAGLADHRAYRDGLRRAHGRKHGFWSLVKD